MTQFGLLSFYFRLALPTRVKNKSPQKKTKKKSTD
jgi:hypothetical protein